VTQAAAEGFCVIVPALGRADRLPHTLESLLAQSYEHWNCWVLDDGSADGTYDVVRDFERRDPRVHGLRLEQVAGNVAVNEIGMDIAVTQACWWTRLGSDDRLEPEKLARDAAALRHYEAVFGPYAVVDDKGEISERRCQPLSRETARRTLRTPGGSLAGSANVAVRTSVLRAVKHRFGSYVDPRLQHMADIHFDFRVSTVTDWVWRGAIEGQLVMDPGEEVCQAHGSGDGVDHGVIRGGSRVRGDLMRPDRELAYGLVAAELQHQIWPRKSPSTGRRALGEVEARRLIGELLWEKATCNWNVAEHGDRLGQMWELGGALVDVPGEVVELGVARGGTTRLLSAMFPEKSVYAIDGFQGLVDADPSVDALPATTFTEIDAEATKAVLRACPNVVLYEGIFPEVVDDRLRGERFALVHLDTDTYRSIRCGLEFFLPRMSPGGRIFVDDYGWYRAPGVQKATREVLEKWPTVRLRRTTPVQAVIEIP
jgi:hypothetical protein